MSNNNSNIKIHSSNEECERVQANIKRESKLHIEPQTVIRNKSVTNGYKKHTIGNNGVITNKNINGNTTIGTNAIVKAERRLITNSTLNTKVHSSNEEQAKVQSNIKRESRLRIEPQTVIRNKSVTNGYKKYTIGNTAILTNARVKAENILNSQGDSGSSTVYMGVKAGGISAKSFKKAQIVQPHVSKVGKYTGKVLTGAVIKSSKGVIKTIAVTRGVANGTIKVQISKENLNKFKNKIVTGITINTYLKVNRLKNSIGKNSINEVKDLATKLTKWSGKTSVKMIKTNAQGAVDIISNTDDTGSQALSLGIKTSMYTYKAVKMTPEIIKKGTYGIKTATSIPSSLKKIAYRRGKGVAEFAMRVRTLGIKDTIRWQRNQTINAVSKAGKSVVSTIINGLKSLSKKVVVPLIILGVVIAVVMNITSAPISAVGAIFGGGFTNKDTKEDIEVRVFLEKAIPVKRDELVNKIMSMRGSNLVENGGQYHFVKLFNSIGGEISVDSNSINRVLHTVEEFISIIEPLFKTIILTDYGLEPTQNEIDKTINEIWDSLVKVTTKQLPTEYCSGEDSCPNYTTIYTNNEDGTVTESRKCLGHKILGIYINMDGIYELLAKYFTNEIDRLANLATRTAEEQERLDELKSNYELCLDYMAEIGADYGSSGTGGSGGNTDISGVELVDGKRPNYDAIVSLANMQLGNIGGKPFWSWYGFGGRVEWCATFVSWCANQTGNISNGKVPKFAYCPTGADWFKQRKQWANGNYSEPIAGDIIFFDWQGDGVTDHVGIVIGNDGKKVYTIEGNSGDVCRRKSYPIGSSVIYGYGLPNY